MSFSSKIKIIYLVNSLTTGGVTEVIKQTVKTISTHFNIKIVTLNNNTSGWDKNLPTEIETFDIPDNFRYRLCDYMRDSFIGKEIGNTYTPVIDYIVKANPDIVHFHTLPRFLKIGVIIKRKINCQLVFTDHLIRIRKHELPWHKTLGMAISLGNLYRKYNLIVVSQSVENVAKNYKFINPKNKFVRIDNSVELHKFKRGLVSVKPESDPTIFIYIARISAVKGHKDLVSAWTLINSQINRELWFVGPDDMNGEIHRLAENVNDKRIVFFGDRKDIKELLEKADIGVFPSYKEGMPLALLEMMAMKLPIIISNIDELTSVITDNKNGLVYPVGDYEQLAKKMESLLEASKLRSKLGDSARKTIDELYSSVGKIKKLEDFYSSLIEV